MNPIDTLTQNINHQPSIEQQNMDDEDEGNGDEIIVTAEGHIDHERDADDIDTANDAIIYHDEHQPLTASDQEINHSAPSPPSHWKAATLDR